MAKKTNPQLEGPKKLKFLIMNLIELTINSLKFDRVTVYQNEAEVTRLLRIHLTSGLSNIQINSVPEYIDTDSIQIFSCCELDIVDVKMSKKTSLGDDGINTLKSEITNLELENQHLKTKLDTASSKMDNLNNFFNNLTRQPTINSLIPYFDCYSIKIDSLTKEKYELETQLKSLEHDLRLKREEYESRLKEFNLVSMHFQVSTTIDTDANIYLSYIVQNVSWTPKYEIRADLVTNNMTLYYYGIVCQSTGEDWKNTMITLSTAQPNTQPSAPLLETQKVRSCPVPLILTY
ncbi:mucoidy inhibitor A [Brachionus plicatilis]|uniref:Mucoidy inhibitor A n=1 Tax=Brachionus plicatilis TaxID=10195 RepID=A0A3M7PW32_BRAPC|nr:mucoidy inhibitor A [Brachionus plicatilis]